MIVTLGQPMKAACAATDVARLPVDAQAAVVKPRRRALESATETTRSLNEPVGIAGVVLQPQFSHAEHLGEAGRSSKRRPSGTEVDGRLARDRAADRP